MWCLIFRRRKGVLNTLTNLGLTNLGLTNLGLTNLGLTNLGLTNLGRGRSFLEDEV